MKYKKRNEFDCCCFVINVFGRDVMVHVAGRCSHPWFWKDRK